jgi:hypothetical protein
MTRSHVAVIPGHGAVARAGGVTYRNLGVVDSGDPLRDWFFTQGVELVVDRCVTTAAGYSTPVSQGYTAAPH